LLFTHVIVFDGWDLGNQKKVLSRSLWVQSNFHFLQSC